MTEPKVVPYERWLRRVLKREEHDMRIARSVAMLQGQRVLVTGSAGSVGHRVGEWLESAKVDWLGVDLAPAANTVQGDVTEWQFAHQAGIKMEPSVVIHCAGAKHAPEGELDPLGVATTNVLGTSSVLGLAKTYGAFVVTLSTCKACDPETAYGASKLIAERMTLSAGGAVARLYNVVQSSGNVFERWFEAESNGERPQVMVADRRFITLDEAVGLVLRVAAEREPGRYSVAGVHSTSMHQVVDDIWPGRKEFFETVPRRRGDRRVEPELARCERSERWAHDCPIVRVTSEHDVDGVRRDPVEARLISTPEYERAVR